MKNSNRRDFLKNTLLGTTASLLAAPQMLHSMTPQGSPSKELQSPIKRKLGKTGITLPVVSMGVMRADNPGLVRAAAKAGIVHFDTASSYQRGRNEEMIGTVLKDFPRESYVLGTKVGYEGRDDFLKKFAVSLQRLQTEYVDILYVHGLSSRSDVVDPDLLSTLMEIQSSGRALHLGVSTHKNEPEVIRAVAESGVYGVVLTAINFRQDHFQEVKSAIADAAKVGVGIIAMKTMAGGYFDRGRTEPVNCKAALKWVLQDENITTAIPGITSFDHLSENIQVNFDLTLTDEEKSDLRLGSLQGGLYCNGCEECVESCARRLPIPEMMRAFMYTYGYGNPVMGREVVTGLGLGADPCSGCDTCTARCKKSFAVRERIADVGRLVTVPEEFLSASHAV